MYNATIENQAGVGLSMRRVGYFVVWILMAFWCIYARAAVEGFEESFDGTGPYTTISQNATGLDNPNWSLLSSEPGEFDGEGYIFEHKSLPANGFGWRRNVVGNGSFRQSLRLSQLDMGWTLEFPVPPIESEFAAINLQGVRAQGSLSIIYDPVRLDSEKMVDWGFSTTTGGAIHITVPLSPDIEMGIEQDFERKVAWAWIDSPVTGRIVKGPLAFTPYEDNPSFIDVRANGAATGSASYINGRLDNWSLEPLPNIRADINDDGTLNAVDVDLLSLIIRRNGTDAVADLSIDGKVNQTDLGLWIHDHRKSYFGDANLDGQFNSQDLTLVFQAGGYEDLVEANSSWGEGDWNADAEFTSSDLVVAFQDGGYEKGPRPAESIPEPSGTLPLAIALVVTLRAPRRWEHFSNPSIRFHRSKVCHALMILIGMLVLIASPMAFAAVDGFEESFDGEGSFSSTPPAIVTGLDNPDWGFFVTTEPVGVIENGGYVFQNSLHERSQSLRDNDVLSRDVSGQGSFRESIQLSELEMGTYNPKGPEIGRRSYVQLVHLFPTSEGLGTTIGVLHDPDEPEKMNELAWSYGFGGADYAETVIPRTSVAELGIEYDHLNDTFAFWLDSPATGRMVSPRIIYRRPQNSESSSAFFRAGSFGDFGQMSGRLDNWSLEPLPDIRADINDDGILNVVDVDLMLLIIRRNGTDAVADLSIDGKVDQTDLSLWIHDHRKTYFGDANLDGQFNSQDLTLVFQAGEYEDFVEDNSGWAEGDWNADGEFTSSDLVVAFQDGGYEAGPRHAVNAVPEPAGLALTIPGLLFAACLRRQ